MSIEVMNAVWKHSKAEGRARLVLLAIADHQGEIGAWPSIERLAEMVNASPRSVQRDIQILQAMGELTVEVQNAPIRNQYKSNLYWVNLPGVTAGVTDIASGVTNKASGVTAGGVLTVTEPLLETNNINTLFDEFWKEYPRKLDKGAARRAFKSALNRAKFEDILAGAIAYQHDERVLKGYVKLASTWLNADAWENQVEPAPGTVAYEKSQERRRKALEESRRFLAEQEAQALKSAPAPQCEHGKNLLLCRKCLK